MCLAIPAQVISVLSDDMAVVMVANEQKRISVAFLDKVMVGDYVLVHLGYALHKLCKEEAALTLSLMEEAGILRGEDEAGAPVSDPV